MEHSKDFAPPRHPPHARMSAAYFVLSIFTAIGMSGVFFIGLWTVVGWIVETFK